MELSQIMDNEYHSKEGTPFKITRRSLSGSSGYHSLLKNRAQKSVRFKPLSLIRTDLQISRLVFVVSIVTDHHCERSVFHENESTLLSAGQFQDTPGIQHKEKFP